MVLSREMLFDCALEQGRHQLYRRLCICIWKEQIWFKTLLSVSKDFYSPVCPQLPRLLSSIFLFSWIAPRWLRLCPQVIELKTSLCLYLFWFWYPMLYDVNPKLAWRHCLIVCSDLAPSTYAPHSCSPSDTRACSYLLLFSAGTYGLLKKRWRRYSENRGRSPWVLKEILWVSWWKSVVLQLRSQKGKKHRGNNLKSLTHPGTKMTSVFPELP